MEETTTQYRLTIPSSLRKLSSISDCTSVAVMLKDKDTVYLMPSDKYNEGKLLGIRQIDSKNRINISSIWYNKGKPTFYLRKGVIYIWWPCS